MYIPVLRRAPTEEQKQKQDNSNAGNSVIIICTTIIICSIGFIILMSFVVLRALRRKNCSPKYLPGKFLKQKWTQWRPGVRYGHVPGQPSQPRNGDTAYHGGAGGGSEMNTALGADGVNRGTSVRSIISLPAYSSHPKPTEQVIGREGERAGMDVVVEFPETAEEEETRREEMMEALYQLRLQRRREWEERHARRQARREARAIGSVFRLENLRVETQSRRRNDSAGANSGTSSANRSTSSLVREHTARGRKGRISRVNYAALGCVRHDGSRVRADSGASDSQLLDPSAPSDGHSRGDSASSLRSLESASDAETLTQIPSHTQSLPPQSTSGPESDIGALNIPPPHYDDLEWGEAPAYETHSARDPSPERPASLQLPQVQPLPSIQIELASPASPSPNEENTPEEHESSNPPSVSGSTEPDHAPTSSH